LPAKALGGNATWACATDASKYIGSAAADATRACRTARRILNDPGIDVFKAERSTNWLKLLAGK
jgi:hypothetical protein